jgi:O-antigen/teichoic acid export membrane protein
LNNGTDLTSGPLLARNALINLVSDVIPFLVAIFAIPALIHGIGVDRYGVLTLSMMAVGYLGAFDFGLGRAATKFIAEAATSGENEKIPGLFWTSLYLMVAFGSISGIIVAALAPWLAHDVLKIPAALRPESVRALYLLGLSMPFAISGGSLNGALSAFQRFDLVNSVRVPTGIFSYLGPLLVLPFSHSIAAMVAIMALGRVAGWLASLGLCLRTIPPLGRQLRPHPAALRSMLIFGGWVTVSGILSPIMVYFDRFLVGATLSVAAVAYYTVPFQITGKLGVLPAAIGGVVFAAFSGSLTRNPARATLIFDRAARYTLLALFGPVMLIVTFAPELLSLWLGPSFAARSAPVLRWLTVAAFVNCLAWTPFGFVQAANRPDLTAKLHLVEVPLYVALLWWMLVHLGLEGAAIAYALRVGVDAAVLFFLARRLMPDAGSVTRRIAILTCIAFSVFATGVIPTDLASKCILVAGVLILFAGVGWNLLLQTEEMNFVRAWCRFSRTLPMEAQE